MTVSARFPPSLAGRLHQYCLDAGITKTHVVQEAVVEYLARAQALPGAPSGLRRGAAADALMPASPLFNAFQAAGLIGLAGLVGQVRAGRRGPVDAPQADKQAVRRAVLARRAAKP